MNNKLQLQMKLGWVAAFAMVASGCSLQPKKEVQIQQAQESTINKTNPRGVVDASSPAQLAPKVGKISVSIVDADTLADKVANGAVQVNLKAEGEGADLVTLLCRDGEVPDVWRASYRVCNSGGKGHIISKLVVGKSYAIGVVAQNPETGEMTQEVSATFTVKTLNQTEGTPTNGSATPADPPSPLLVRAVGDIWKVYIPSNMYIQGYTSDSGLQGGVDLYQVKDDQGFFTEACTDSAAKLHEEISMKDSMGTQRTYCHSNLLYNDFMTATENRIGRNHLTISTPLAKLATPGFDSQGRFTGFERLVVNTYNSRELGGNFNSDYNAKRDLFVRLCGGKQTQFARTDLPASMVKTGRSAQMRVCRTNIDFGLEMGSKDVWIAQILAVDSGQEYDTEIVYITQWESATEAGSFANNVYKIIWTYFEPVNVYFRDNAISVPSSLPAPASTSSLPQSMGIPSNLGTI